MRDLRDVAVSGGTSSTAIRNVSSPTMTARGATSTSARPDLLRNARSPPITELGLDPPAAAAEPPAERAPLRARVDAFERSLLADMLRETEGNQSEAARRLGITRSTLIEKLKRHRL